MQRSQNKYALKMTNIKITPTLGNDFEGVLGVWKSFLKIIFLGAIFLI